MRWSELKSKRIVILRRLRSGDAAERITPRDRDATFLVWAVYLQFDVICTYDLG